MTSCYTSETEKVLPHIAQFLRESILDIGCGTRKVSPGAIGVDVRKTEAVDHVIGGFDKLSEELIKIGLVNKWDTVFSSHCLEHLVDDWGALEDWCNLLTKGGRLILYLPDDEHYDNDSNPDHKHRYRYLQFMEEFKARAPFMEIIASGPDIGYDRYSFYLVACNTCKLD